MANSDDRRLSLSALIALVVGSMIGSGIFALPAAFGRATGAWRAYRLGHRRCRHADAGLRVPDALATPAGPRCRHLRVREGGLRRLPGLHVGLRLLDRVPSGRRRLPPPDQVDAGHVLHARLQGLEGNANGAATSGGFSLHAGIDIQPGQRAKLERLCRYASRHRWPPNA